MKVHIITRCTRPENLLKVKESIKSSIIEHVNIVWHVLFDTSKVKNINTSIIQNIDDIDIETKTYFWDSMPGDMGHQLINRIISIVDDKEWIYVLDDDNEMHPDLFKEILFKVNEADGFIFSQYIGSTDFSGLEIREALPQNVKVGHIDMAQFILRKKLINHHRLVPMQYTADGIFIQTLYDENVDSFIFIDKILCTYNSLSIKSKQYSLPRVLLIGNDNIDIKSIKHSPYESDDLNVISCLPENTISGIIDHNPDSIITVGENFEQFKEMASLPPDFRLRWFHTEKDPDGEIAYRCAMNYILKYNDQDLVSVFTPIYNTKSVLHRTYGNLRNQTYTNWEWVIVNDSSDTETILIAEEIAKNDPRVKVYDFKEKTKGIIGESKYRACSLSRGKYLVELDHDDILLPHALNDIVRAFNKYDVGFVYSDCAEINEQHGSLTYGEFFAFGYGSYNTETYNGIEYQVAVTPNINPLTIRHIVGVPNHVRSWRRDVYFQVGGHNRRLSIADDYELIVRTFLVTKFARIAKCCYLQIYHGNNSQDASRADIQRRVRSIAFHYNEDIKKRFEDLGLEDWAYNKDCILNSPARFGDKENSINYTMYE